MSFSDVSSAANFFSQANEGFTTTTSGSTASGATSVGLNSVAGLTNGSVFVGVIEPGETKEQVFTGLVDTSGSQITSVVWTKGANVTHSTGVSVVDYDTGTHHNLTSTGILKEHNKTGSHTNITGTTVNVTGAVSADTVSEHTAASGVTVDGLQIKDSALVNLSLPYKFRASMNAATNTGNGAFSAAIPFDTEQFDTGGNLLAGVFTAPVAGFYQFNWQITATLSNGADEQYMASLYKNGSEYSRGSEVNSQLINGSHGSDLIQAAASDTFDIRVFAPTTRALLVGFVYTNYFSGYFVSAT